MLSEYISQEIDLEILDMLIQNAVTVDAWSAVLGTVVDINAAGQTVLVSSAQTAAATGAFYNQQSWFQTLGTKIQKVSNKIHQKTMRGGANFLVCSPDVATILESIPGYTADTNGDKMQFAMGVQKVLSVDGTTIINTGVELITGSGLCYSPVDPPLDSGNKKPNTSNNLTFDTSITFTGTGGTYYIRAYVTNAGGTAYSTKTILLTFNNMTGLFGITPP
jgi:hypothetical protein